MAERKPTDDATRAESVARGADATKEAAQGAAQETTQEAVRESTAFQVVPDAKAAASSTVDASATSIGQAGASKAGGVSIRVLNAVMIVLVAIVSLVFLQGIQSIQQAHQNLEVASTTYMVCEAAANELRDASAGLTSNVRAYAVTQDADYLQGFFGEVLVEQRRERAVEVIRDNYVSDQTLVHLERALQNSNKLLEREKHAILLVASAVGHDLSPYRESLGDLQLSAEDRVLSADEKIQLAIELVYDEEYSESVERIMDDVQQCKETLVNDLGNAQEESSETMRGLLLRQQVITWVLLAVVVVLILLLIALILWPLRHYIVCVSENEPLPGTGAAELRSLSQAYNVMYEENLKNHAALRKEAEHDFLTGLFNRGAFDRLLKAYHDEPFALLLIDADHFKEINDTLGHDGGDAMLRKIANALTHSFRTSDYPCRIGGDEFAVIMTDMHEDLSYVISNKITSVTNALGDTSDGLPAMTLSIGVAFNDGTLDTERVFKNADNALYRVKEAGRNSLAFYEGE